MLAEISRLQSWWQVVGCFVCHHYSTPLAFIEPEVAIQRVERWITHWSNRSVNHTWSSKPNGRPTIGDDSFLIYVRFILLSQICKCIPNVSICVRQPIKQQISNLHRYCFQTKPTKRGICYYKKIQRTRCPSLRRCPNIIPMLVMFVIFDDIWFEIKCYTLYSENCRYP